MNDTTMPRDSQGCDGEMNDTPKPTTPRNGSALRDRQGWDGKLRMDKKAMITNAEVLSDAEYSDEDAPAVEQIGADEGQRVSRCMLTFLFR